MNVTALLTGRGNNTLKDKNVLPLNGHPVMYYISKIAQLSPLISNYFVSSECEKILTEGSNMGYEKIVRPVNLSSPNSNHKDVIEHALYEMDERNVKTEILVVLLANAPIVKQQWIDECIQKILDNKELSAVVPVNMDNDKHPYRAKTINSDGILKSFFEFKDTNISSNRQELKPSYYLCHNFWVIRIKKGKIPPVGEQPWGFLGENVSPYVVHEEHDIYDIHNIHDMELASRWLIKNNIN